MHIYCILYNSIICTFYWLFNPCKESNFKSRSFVKSWICKATKSSRHINIVEFKYKVACNRMSTMCSTWMNESLDWFAWCVCFSHQSISTLGARQHEAGVRHVVAQVDVRATAQYPSPVLHGDVRLYGNSVGTNYWAVSSSLTLDFATFSISVNRAKRQGE